MLRAQMSSVTPNGAVCSLLCYDKMMKIKFVAFLKHTICDTSNTSWKRHGVEALDLGKIEITLRGALPRLGEIQLRAQWHPKAINYE